MILEESDLPPLASPPSRRPRGNPKPSRAATFSSHLPPLVAPGGGRRTWPGCAGEGGGGDLRFSDPKQAVWRKAARPGVPCRRRRPGPRPAGVPSPRGHPASRAPHRRGDGGRSASLLRHPPSLLCHRRRPSGLAARWTVTERAPSRALGRPLSVAAPWRRAPIRRRSLLSRRRRSALAARRSMVWGIAVMPLSSDGAAARCGGSCVKTCWCVVMKAKEAKEKSIASVHTQNHIKLMRNISSKEYDSRRKRTAQKFNSIYFNEGSSESAFLAAGSVIEVSEKVASGELNSAIALVRPPGHHAEHNEAMGFCLFNNVAVGANYLLNERPDLGIKKILIVDWDVHHGNGTQKMFYSDPRVLFFSVHRFDYGSFYPCQGDASHCFIGEGAGQGYNINVPWEHGKCGDADYLAAWDHVLLPVAEAFDPDIILLSAGFDAALGDPLGGCCITPNGYALLLTKLLGFANGRMVMALEGGYNLKSIANSVCACAKVLLGDKFTFNAPEMQPFESTWRVIQMVRDELKTYWPVLSSKLPEAVSLRSTPSYIEPYASSGSESDVEDVDELHDAVSSVDIIQVVDDVLSERITMLKLDQDNLATKNTSSCTAVEQSPSDSVQAQNDGSVVASTRVYDLSFTWRSALSKVYVWYASFGSNMWKPRFLCYIEGGKVDGMSISCFGSHDTSPPRATMWKNVPHRLFFGRSSTPAWGTGGVAFLNPEISYDDNSYICMYKITLEQFNDVLFEENRLVKDNSEDGKIESPGSPLIGLSEMESLSSNKALHLEPIKDSWYSNVLYLGEEDDLPILTMTCPSTDVARYKSGELPLTPPSETYSATLIKGLVEGKQLDTNEAANYINDAAAREL